MNNIIIEEKYKFIPPFRGNFYPAMMAPFISWLIRKDHGITQTEFHGLEILSEAVKAGRAVVLAPNHCRPPDPMVVALGAKKAGTYIYTVASWHLFKQNWLQSFLLPRLGVFSIYREGLDRESLKCCVDILTRGQRPLLLFPEGVINRTNDRLGEFLEGLGMVARLGAKQREDKEVLILPVALRYIFAGDLAASVRPVLDELESRLSWSRRADFSLRQRIDRIAEALLALKEIEYLGQPQSGTSEERIAKLTDCILSPHEQLWLKGGRSGPTKSRVKALRIAVMPTLLKEGTPDETKELIWSALRDVYLAQQLGNYSTEYFSHKATETQIIETVEKFEEDLKDRVRIFRPMHTCMTVLDPIVVGAQEKDQSGIVDRVRGAIQKSLQGY
jgi:1-acyl-sn-glycerol-3-phosphate acyltransferase